MKNAMQMKAIMKNIAAEKNISAQIVLQNFMMERFLERVSVSEYKDSFILKGGFLIAALVGLDTRATMDMDATIKGISVTKETIRDMIIEICGIEIDDGIKFSLNNIGEIREDDEYSGFRISLYANYPPTSVPLKLDITTGDKITPKEIRFQYRLLLEERSISIMAYNLETVLAEKLETIISRGDQNTRSRDYYDIFILLKFQENNFSFEVLKKALIETSKKRGTIFVIYNYSTILDKVRNNYIQKTNWEKYQKKFYYARGILFDQVCESIINLMDKIKII